MQTLMFYVQIVHPFALLLIILTSIYSTRRWRQAFQNIREMQDVREATWQGHSDRQQETIESLMTERTRLAEALLESEKENHEYRHLFQTGEYADGDNETKRKIHLLLEIPE